MDPHPQGGLVVVVVAAVVAVLLAVVVPVIGQGHTCTRTRRLGMARGKIPGKRGFKSAHPTTTASPRGVSRLSLAGGGHGGLGRRCGCRLRVHGRGSSSSCSTGSSGSPGHMAGPHLYESTVIGERNPQAGSLHCSHPTTASPRGVSRLSLAGGGHGGVDDDVDVV